MRPRVWVVIETVQKVAKNNKQINHLKSLPCKVFFTINTEGVFYFDRQGGVVTEYRHHVQEVLKRHTAVTGRRENLNNTLIERIHLKRYNSIYIIQYWYNYVFNRCTRTWKAIFSGYDVPIQNYSSRVFPVDLGKKIFFPSYTGKVLKVANCTFSGHSVTLDRFRKLHLRMRNESA